VYFFQGGSDGDDPLGGVALGAHGALYGTTYGGGVNEGTVYELTPPSKAGGIWGHTVLHSFGSVGGDGMNPQGPLVADKNGVLYGATYVGGLLGYGAVYTLTPPAVAGGAWTYNVIYSFQAGDDGAYPWWAGVVFGKNGVLYGTTAYGGGSGNSGNGWGTVFELTPPVSPGGAWTESILYSFTGGKDGGYPQASLLYTGGALYGTAYTGGIAACGSLGTEGCGTVFELKPRAGGGTWKETVLHTFTGGNDGGLSSAPLIIKNGVLYGTTSQEDSYYDNGGDCTWGCGTVFALAPPAVPGAAWTETVLYHFQAPYPPPYSTCLTEQCDASDPVGGVVFGPNGSLYGTTASGGAFGTGTIFELAPPASAGGAWTETVLYDESFDAATGGYTSFPQSPFAGLTVGKKGELYGTGAGAAGMVFELATGAGAYNTVPGSSNPFLAGAPDGTPCCSGDSAPEESPVMVGTSFAPGDSLTFSVSGSVSYAGGAPVDPPDGSSSVDTGPTLGIAEYTGPVDALAGVFLNGSPPSTAPNGLNFTSSGLGTSFKSLSPGLAQVFFIGDGLTGNGKGSVQTFVVPAGATALYLGATDGAGWYNNSGSFAVTVTVKKP
jgi:uncharacterized repeat protein (TIGR03803 family)